MNFRPFIIINFIHQTKYESKMYIVYYNLINNLEKRVTMLANEQAPKGVWESCLFSI